MKGGKYYIILCAHSKDVADGVVFSLDSERRRIDYLGVSLVRNLLGALRDDESLVTVGGIHGFLSLLLSLCPLQDCALWRNFVLFGLGLAPMKMLDEVARPREE